MASSLFRRSAPALALAALLATATAAHADDPSFTLTIKDHHFSPATIEVPADTKFTLVVKNEDPTPEEFESKPLRREKVVGGGKEITVALGPLKAGTYPFVGEYHEDVAKGQIVAK